MICTSSINLCLCVEKFCTNETTASKFKNESIYINSIDSSTQWKVELWNPKFISYKLSSIIDPLSKLCHPLIQQQIHSLINIKPKWCEISLTTEKNKSIVVGIKVKMMISSIDFVCLKMVVWNINVIIKCLLLYFQNKSNPWN